MQFLLTGRPSPVEWYLHSNFVGHISYIAVKILYILTRAAESDGKNSDSDSESSILKRYDSDSDSSPPKTSDSGDSDSFTLI